MIDPTVGHFRIRGTGVLNNVCFPEANRFCEILLTFEIGAVVQHGQIYLKDAQDFHATEDVNSLMLAWKDGHWREYGRLFLPPEDQNA